MARVLVPAGLRASVRRAVAALDPRVELEKREASRADRLVVMRAGTAHTDHARSVP